MSTWKVVPGTTVSFTYRWGANPFIYLDVSISRLTPLRLTATGHGIPDGWSVAIAEFDGISSLQAESWPPGGCDFRPIRAVDANTIEFNTIDAARLSGAAVGDAGVIAYETPVDLSGYTGVMTIDGVASPISAVLDNTAKTITVTVPVSTTETFSVGTSMSFSLKMTATVGGAVTQLDFGTIEVVDGSSC